MLHHVCTYSRTLWINVSVKNVQQKCCISSCHLAVVWNKSSNKFELNLSNLNISYSQLGVVNRKTKHNCIFKLISARLKDSGSMSIVRWRIRYLLSVSCCMNAFSSRCLLFVWLLILCISIYLSFVSISYSSNTHSTRSEKKIIAV